MSAERHDAINVEVSAEVELRYGPNFDSKCLEDNHGLDNFFIFPLEEQSLESGWVALGGYTEKGGVQKVYLPFSEEMKRYFISDLMSIEGLINDNRKNHSPTPRILSDMHAVIERTLKGVSIVGPNSIMPFD